MPKLKTRRSVAKRFRITAGGKVRRFHAYKSHLLTGKNRKRKRNLKQPDLIAKVDLNRVRRLLPYG